MPSSAMGCSSLSLNLFCVMDDLVGVGTLMARINTQFLLWKNEEPLTQLMD